MFDLLCFAFSCVIYNNEPWKVNRHYNRNIWTHSSQISEFCYFFLKSRKRWYPSKCLISLFLETDALCRRLCFHSLDLCSFNYGFANLLLWLPIIRRCKQGESNAFFWHRFDYQPLFGNSLVSLLGEERRPDSRKRRKSSLWQSICACCADLWLRFLDPQNRSCLYSSEFVSYIRLLVFAFFIEKNLLYWLSP